MDNNPLQQDPRLTGQPDPYQTQPGVVYGQVSSPTASQPKSHKILRSRKAMVIAGVSAFVLICLIAVLVIVLGGDSQKKQSTDDNSTATQQNFLNPAKAIDVEQTKDSISHDISGMNDDQQLPATRLDDKTLGL